MAFRPPLVALNRRVEIYEMARVDMIANQADKQKIWEVIMVMESCYSYLIQFFQPRRGTPMYGFAHAGTVRVLFWPLLLLKRVRI